MFYNTLLLFALVFYAPPVFLIRRMFDSGAVSLSVLQWLMIPVHNLLVAASLIIGYLLVSAMGVILLRLLWPGDKPLLLRWLCVPDDLGGFNLLILVIGAALAAWSIYTRTSIELTVLGIVITFGIVGHFWEMTEWQFDLAEAARRRWVREL